MFLCIPMFLCSCVFALQKKSRFVVTAAAAALCWYKQTGIHIVTIKECHKALYLHLALLVSETLQRANVTLWLCVVALSAINWNMLDFLVLIHRSAAHPRMRNKMYISFLYVCVQFSAPGVVQEIMTLTWCNSLDQMHHDKSPKLLDTEEMRVMLYSSQQWRDVTWNKYDLDLISLGNFGYSTESEQHEWPNKNAKVAAI